MSDRPAVFLRIEDADGAFGQGEVFANWPAAGAEHRVNLLEMDIAPLVLGRSYERPEALFRELDELTRIRALQCGEPGPFNQVIAGLDIALWDLFARREGLSLRKLLNPDAADQVQTYASGIAIGAAPELIETARKAGFTRFKVKVGFDFDRDVALVLDLAKTLQPHERLCADANQAWGPEEACRFMKAVEGANLLWMEEPLPAFASPGDWQALAAACATPLAGGENIVGFRDFEAAIASGVFSFIQPDIIKWGGLTGCLQVARAAMASGRCYCPHFLGGGIGLLASAELLAAAGGEGFLEIDVNPNPLREAFLPASLPISNGVMTLANEPGIGITGLPEAFAPFLTRKISLEAG